MTLAIVLAIIIVGLLLIFLEMFVVPGTALFGIAGGIAVVAGVIMMYNYFGSTWGNITALLTTLAVGVVIIAGFRVIQSNRIAMKAEINSKVNELEQHLYNLGEKGITATELRPNGKAQFGNNKTEVFSTGEYIQRGTEVEIIKITNNRIFVKPTKI
ncbi:MAG TPA: NfeD family protein [Chitinophagales bacterium]|nr:NfeD family protein [Chitinophagales bacterium]